MSSYSTGRDVEYAVTNDLRDNGYRIQRAASSKGFSDVAAIKWRQLLLVSVKRTNPVLSPAARAELLATAACISDAIPLVAYKPKGEPLRYRQLTGPGPKDWTPWTPDEVAP